MKKLIRILEWFDPVARKNDTEMRVVLRDNYLFTSACKYYFSRKGYRVIVE